LYINCISVEGIHSFNVLDIFNWYFDM